MDEQKPQVEGESNNIDAASTKPNGEVIAKSAEANLDDFVVLDDGDSKKVDSSVAIKEPVIEAKENSDESAVKTVPPAKEVKEDDKEKESIVHDNEKNGDSLILTADEDLEAETSSPKKPAPAVVKEEPPQTATDSTLPNSVKVEPSDTAKPATEKPPGSKNQRVIWVSNISKTIKATDLKQHLSKAGKVTTAKIVTDGKRCFGYVWMENANDASECVKTLNNTSFDGKNIILSFEHPTKSDPAKSSESDAKKPKESSRISRATDTKRPEKRRRSLSKQSTGKDKNGSESKPNSENKPKTEDSSESSAKQPEKKARSRSLSRERYIRARNERDRLRRRLVEEERKNHDARMRQIEVDERQREKEFKLEQERRKLQLERELFEKQKREWARINEERRKLEKARLEVEHERAKLEEDLKKERFKRKSPDVPSVVSKIADPKKVAKMMKRDGYKNMYDGSAPPPPKLGMDFDHGGRKSNDNKIGRPGARKIDVAERKFYPDSNDRKKHYDRKPDFEDNKPYIKRYPGERPDDHRTQWSSSMPYGSVVGSSTPRYQESGNAQPYGGGSSRTPGGYYYHPNTSAPEYPRYDQVSNRKY